MSTGCCEINLTSSPSYANVSRIAFVDFGETAADFDLAGPLPGFDFAAIFLDLDFVARLPAFELVGTFLVFTIAPLLNKSWSSTQTGLPSRGRRILEH